MTNTTDRDWSDTVLDITTGWWAVIACGFPIVLLTGGMVIAAVVR